MGGGHKYLYHIENNDDNSASSSTDDTPSAVIEHLIGTTSIEKELALHPKFLYESSSADDDYIAPPRIVEFYAPWYVISIIVCVIVSIVCAYHMFTLISYPIATHPTNNNTIGVHTVNTMHQNTKNYLMK